MRPRRTQNSLAKRPPDRAALDLAHDTSTARKRAERVLKELGLRAEGADLLADLYLAFGHERRDVLARLREQQADLESIRQALEDLRTRQEDELAWRFGREIAGRIVGLESDRGPARLRGGSGSPSGAAHPGNAGR